MTDEKYYKSLPMKPMGAGVLFFNRDEKLLVVKPTYKEYWGVPCGVVDLNESPYQACVREIQEELGLKVTTLRLLCVHYSSPAHSNYPTKTENFQFIFDGGILNETQISRITIPPAEIASFDFKSIEDALLLFNSNLALRIPYCMKARISHGVAYMENETLIE